MKKINVLNKIVVLSFTLTAGLQSLAYEIPKPFLAPSKMTDAWSGLKPQDLTDETTAAGMLSMSVEKEKNFDFDLAARWDLKQVEPALLSYQYLLKNGFNETHSFLKKFLGVSGVVFGYHYDVKPAFRDGLYTRTDSYVTHPTLPGQATLIRQEADRLIGYLNPAYSVEFGFYRQFQDAKEALLSRPYFVQNLPLNSENTLKNLKPGDLFTFNAHLDILLAVEVLHSLELLQPGVSFGPYGVLSGGFKVHVLRLPNNKIHYKIFSFRNQGVGVSAEVGLINTPKITRIGTIDDTIIEKIMGETNLLSLKYQKNWNESLLLDYVLDLNNPEVAKAFDDSMSQVREFNYMQAGNPQISKSQYMKSTLTNVVGLEDLVKKNVITATHKTSNKATTSGDLRLRLGNKIIRFEAKQKNANNELNSVDNSGLNQKYSLLTQKSSTEFSFFYSLIEKNEKNMIGNLASSEPVGFIYSTEKTKRSLSKSSLKSLQKEFELSLPEVSKNVDFSNWMKSDANEFNNVVSRTQSIIPMTAIQSIPAMTSREIGTLFLQHLSQLPVKEYLSKEKLEKRPGENRETGAERVERAVSEISLQLEKIVSRSTSADQKMKILTKLFDDRLFRMTGLGFLIRLIPTEEGKRSVYVSYQVSATNGPTLRSVTGPGEKLEFYNHVLSIDNLTNDEDVNMNLEAQGFN